MKFDNPVITTKRDGVLLDIIESGREITSRDILEIEYGCWPPQGVDSYESYWLNKKVSFYEVGDDARKSEEQKKKVREDTRAYVVNKIQAEDPDDRRMFLNQDAFSRSHQEDKGMKWSDILSNEYFLTFCSLNSWVITAEFWNNWGCTQSFPLPLMLIPLLGTPLITLAGLKLPLRPEVDITRNLKYRNLFRLKKFSDLTLASTIGHENIHILENDRYFHEKSGFDRHPISYPVFEKMVNKSYETFIKKNIYNKMRHNVLVGDDESVKYYSEDAELLARLHTTMTEGYQRWHRLPQTRAELWSALMDVGFSAPKSIRKSVAQEVKRNKSLNDFLSISGKFRRTAVWMGSASTTKVSCALTYYKYKGFCECLWYTGLPMVYAQLLDLYGDPFGYKKMGLVACNDHEIFGSPDYNKYNLVLLLYKDSDEIEEKNYPARAKAKKEMIRINKLTGLQK